MKLSNCKLIAFIILLVIFASIFFIMSAKYELNDTVLLSYYPALENMVEEELINLNENFQVLKWNKNIFLSLNIEYILFSILIYSDLLKLRHSEFINAILKFFSFSAFVAFFINKKDGKKDKYVYS